MSSDSIRSNFGKILPWRFLSLWVSGDKTLTKKIVKVSAGVDTYLRWQNRNPFSVWRSRTITIIEITHAAALREIRLVPGQIANIISYRIITANCSRLPLPTSLHTATPVATRRPRFLCPLTSSSLPRRRFPCSIRIRALSISLLRNRWDRHSGCCDQVRPDRSH